MGMLKYLIGARKCNRLTIFIFHQILAKPDPLRPTEPDAVWFDKICKFIANNYKVLSLRDAAVGLYSGSLPRLAACITFDDGYRDNFDIALPILLRYELTATFFIATAYLDGGRMWNDIIIEALRVVRPGMLDLSDFGLSKVAIEDSMKSRLRVGCEIIKTIKYLHGEKRQAIADAVGNLGSLPDESDLMMSTENVRQLCKAGMEIGAHTHSHPILSSIPPEQAKWEIFEGRRLLENIVGGAVEVFAYPNGNPEQDYDESHVDMVRQAGFIAAVSTRRAIASKDSDLLQLPRFTPWERTLPRFALRCGLELIGISHWKATAA